MGDEFGIYYRPEEAGVRVARARRAMIVRLASTLFSLVLIGAAWLIWPDSFGASAPWFGGIALLTGCGLGAADLIRWRRATADARTAVPGLAIGLNRDGMLIGQRWLPWPEVGSMLVKPASLGASSSLETTGRDLVTCTVPLDLTDAMPASLDSAVRVLSGGRAWVDLSRLD